MTSFADNIYTGQNALTSGQSSLSPAMFSRTFNFSGANASTQQFVFPEGVQNLDAKCYVIVNGSAATNDSIVVSAGGTTLLTFSAMGSAGGIIRQTTAGLGTFTPIASACANLSTTAEVSAAITIASVDVAATYQVQLMFTRARSTYY